jgi:prepilin-type processing-associated H-X9-DG protein
MPPGYFSIIDDGQWAARTWGASVNRLSDNTLSLRHSGKAEVLYGDSHAQATSYKQAEDADAVIASF